MEDADLLRRYVDHADQAAFAELVARRLPLVYSAALRQVGGDAHLARDVAQGVFTDLARKAAVLAERPVLAGWLYTSTGYAAAKAVRAEQRRRRREREAQLMEDLTRDSEPEANWDALRPVIDAALRELGERDREAVLLRFFENRGFAEIGQRLRLGENGARMRVERALDKLHGALERRGIRSSAAALGAALGAHAVVAAPSGLAATIASGVPVATGAAGLAGILMSVTKIQWAAGTAVLVAGALTGVVQYRANAALARDVAQLHAMADDVGAEYQRLRAPSAGSDERERLRAAAAELPELQRRTRERIDELQKLRATKAARAKSSPVSSKVPAPGEVFEAAQLDAMPRPVKQMPPTYPAALRDFGITGRARVSFVIDATGRVVDAKVLSSTHDAFEKPALDALAEWQFAPGQKNGAAVNARVQMDLVFDVRRDGSWF